MMGYHTTLTSVAATLTQFSTPPLSWRRWRGGCRRWSRRPLRRCRRWCPGHVDAGVGGGWVVVGVDWGFVVDAGVGGLGVAAVDVGGQIAMYPASMAISPLMSVFQMASQSSAGTAALAGADAAGLGADAAKFVGNAVPDLKPFGGAGGWVRVWVRIWVRRGWWERCRCPRRGRDDASRMVSSAMSGMGEMPNAAAMAGAAQAGGSGMMPMPMPMGGGAGGMPGA